MTTLAENLRYFRIQKGDSMGHISRLLYVARHTYSRYERNLAKPSIDRLIALADYYFITLDELVGRPFKKPSTRIGDSLSANLVLLRKKNGVMQGEMASFLRITAPSYYQYEYEKALPPLERLIQIADFYDISLDALVGRHFEPMDMRTAQ